MGGVPQHLWLVPLTGALIAVTLLSLSVGPQSARTEFYLRVTSHILAVLGFALLALFGP
jgi:hypothetical protein